MKGFRGSEKGSDYTMEIHLNHQWWKIVYSQTPFTALCLPSGSDSCRLVEHSISIHKHATWHLLATCDIMLLSHDHTHFHQSMHRLPSINAQTCGICYTTSAGNMWHHVVVTWPCSKVDHELRWINNLTTVTLSMDTSCRWRWVLLAMYMLVQP